MKRISTILILLFFVLEKGYSEQTCRAMDAPKKFLTGFLETPSSWIVESQNATVIPIQEVNVDKNGAIWIKTHDADFFPVFVGVFEDESIEILLTGIKYNLVSKDYANKLKAYDSSRIKYVLRPSESYCSNRNLEINIVTSNYPDEKRSTILRFKSKKQRNKEGK